MGGIFSRHKNDGGRRFLGIPLCPSGKQNSQKVFKKVNVQPEYPVVIDEKHVKSASSEWTTVPLHVPDTPEITTPVPPPRKHKKGGTLPRTPSAIEESLIHVQKTNTLLSDTRIPVEEPIIIPKKEPVHICDGHHHHVVNTVDGKVIHDTHIHGHGHSHKHAEPTETRPPRKEAPVRPKHSSTVSLPNFEELSNNVNKKQKVDPTKPYNNKKKPTRHISVLSLPTESNKVSLSATTVARLENYMKRCKSFGALPPKQLLEKLESNQKEYNSDSDDSWEGLDDWDIGIIEHDGFKGSPLEPKYRLAPQTNRPQTPDHRLPDTIEEVEEICKIPLPPGLHNNGIITLKKQERRRESIDDFFDAKALLPIKLNTLDDIKKESLLGRRGSDGLYGYDKKCYPFKSPDVDSSFNSDTFFTNALLMSESKPNEDDMLKKRRQSAGDALHKIAKKEVEKPLPSAEDDLLDTFQQFYSDKNSSSKTEEEKMVTPPNAEKVEHSSLLKFLQENSPDRDTKNVVYDEEKSQPLKSALKDVEEKLHKLEDIKIADRS